MEKGEKWTDLYGTIVVPTVTLSPGSSGVFVLAKAAVEARSRGLGGGPTPTSHLCDTVHSALTAVMVLSQFCLRMTQYIQHAHACVPQLAISFARHTD
eukprot:COSAG02_NODE_822_length_16778_cov_4.476168_5_plen_98_part_00